MKDFKIIVEKHADGYMAYPLGISGIVAGEGETYEEAVADIKSAVASHLKTFIHPTPVSDLEAAYQAMAKDGRHEAMVGDVAEEPLKTQTATQVAAG